MLGPIPKTGCGLGALVTSPIPTSTCSWQSCSLTPAMGAQGHTSSPLE